MKKALLVLLFLVSILGTDARAVIWNQVEFTSQAPDQLIERAKLIFADRIERANQFHPDQPVEIFLGQTRWSKDWNTKRLNIYIRGNPEFCTEDGCLLAIYGEDQQGLWRKELEVQSNGYLMVTDIARNGRAVLISETATSCLNLVWEGVAYGEFRREGPCVDRPKRAKEDTLAETVRAVREALRKGRIGYRGLKVENEVVMVSLRRVEDLSLATAQLPSVAQKIGATIEVDGALFRIIPSFGEIPRFLSLNEVGYRNYLAVAQARHLGSRMSVIPLSIMHLMIGSILKPSVSLRSRAIFA